MEWQVAECELRAIVDEAGQATHGLFADRRVALVQDLPPGSAAGPVRQGPHGPGDDQPALQRLQVRAGGAGPGADRAAPPRARATSCGSRTMARACRSPTARRSSRSSARSAAALIKDKPKGTGLGLTICRQIVEHFGGRIWAEDAALGGAAICFFLPAAVAGDQGRGLRRRQLGVVRCSRRVRICPRSPSRPSRPITSAASARWVTTRLTPSARMSISRKLPSLLAHPPVDQDRRLARRAQDPGGDHGVALVDRLGAGDLERLAVVPAHPLGHGLHDQLVEQPDELGLLLGRGLAPVAAQHQPGDQLEIGRLVQELLELVQLRWCFERLFEHGERAVAQILDELFAHCRCPRMRPAPSGRQGRCRAVPCAGMAVMAPDPLP